MNRKALAVGGVGVVVAIAALAAASGALGSRKQDVTYLTARAAVTDVRDTVSISGSIRPVDEYGLGFGMDPVRGPKDTASTAISSAAAGAATPTWTVDTVNVLAGDIVRRGDTIATAGTDDAEVALTVARANLDAARARLRLDRRPVTNTTKAKARLGVTQARQQVSQAEQSRSGTQSQGRLAISQATDLLREARAKLAADQASGAPATVVDADRAAVTQASRALASTRQQVSAANSQANSAVAAARLGVESARLSYRGATDVSTAAAVAADRAAVAQAEAAVTDAERTLDLATIRAPIDGIVSSVDIQPGDATSGIVIRVREAAVEVAASVTESDVPSVRPGQPAEVSITALGTDVKGSVESVDVADATKGAGGVVSFPVVIRLAAIPDGVAPSMTADVGITTASALAVLAVPATAIGGAPGAYTVTVLDAPDRTRTLQVTVGLLTADLAQITSGIEAGTEVVTGTATAKDLVTTFPTGPGAGGQGGAGGAGGPGAPRSSGSQP